MPLLEDAPPRLRAPLRQVASLAATSLWVAPAIAAVIAVLLAVGLLVWDPRMEWLPLRLEEAAAAARAGLSAVITATVAAVSLVGTGTIVALQLATGQYSPRLLRGVLKDPGIRWSLAGLVGVVVYTMLVLTQTSDVDPPAAAIGVGLLSGVMAVGLLVLFVHEVSDRMRLESILKDVTDQAMAAVGDTYPDDSEATDTAVPDGATCLPAGRSGYVQSVSWDVIARAAAEHRVHVRLRLPVGEFLVRGTTAAWTWPAEDADGPLPDGAEDALTTAVDHALAMGVDRTIRSDPAYGLRHLVDIGLRGVSPSVNDPTTTIQCIANATRVLVRLAQRPLHAGVTTRDGCRVVLPRPDLGDHLTLAQSQLLQYGGHDVRVVEALAQQLRDLGEATPADHGLLREHLQRLRADAVDRDHRPHDRELLESALAHVEEVLSGTADEEDPSAG